MVKTLGDTPLVCAWLPVKLGDSQVAETRSGLITDSGCGGDQAGQLGGLITSDFQLPPYDPNDPHYVMQRLR